MKAHPPGAYRESQQGELNHLSAASGETSAERGKLIYVFRQAC
jgi:hypothetical protein